MLFPTCDFQRRECPGSEILGEEQAKCCDETQLSPEAAENAVHLSLDLHIRKL